MELFITTSSTRQSLWDQKPSRKGKESVTGRLSNKKGDPKGVLSMCVCDQETSKPHQTSKGILSDWLLINRMQRNEKPSLSVIVYQFYP